MYMDFQFQHSSQSTKLIIIGLFLLVSYLLYSLTVSVYKSYQIDVHIKQFENENKRIAEENRSQSDDYEYYSSTAYIEKMAKQNLGLVNRGEEVIIIPGDSFDNSEEGTISDVEEGSAYSALSNPQKWWKFFFDRDTESY